MSDAENPSQQQAAAGGDAAPSSDASAAAAAGEETQQQLVQADQYDFIPGNDLFVRGRAALVSRFDYPHVYWQWASDVAEGDKESALMLHRSYSTTPAIFQVRADKKRTAPSVTATTGDDEDEPSSEEEDEEAERRAHMERLRIDEQREAEAAAAAGEPAAPVAAAEASDDSAAKDSGAGDGAESSRAGGANARASLMSVFARRPQRAIFSDVHDLGDEVSEITATAPQSVSLERCHRSKFRVLHKVSQLTLLECEEIDVEFFGVISSVELIRCRACRIKCLRAAATYTIDESEGCTLEFPGRQSRVMVVATQSTTGTALVAQPGQTPAPHAADAEQQQEAEEKDEEEWVDIPAEVRFELEPPALESAAPAAAADEPAIVPQDAPGGDSPAAAASAPPPTKQYQTVWENGAFTTHALERQGPLGYFANNK